jgi:hypothetical protein
MILLLVDLLLFGSERDRGCTPGPLLAYSKSSPAHQQLLRLFRKWFDDSGHRRS